MKRPAFSFQSIAWARKIFVAPLCMMTRSFRYDACGDEEPIFDEALNARNVADVLNSGVIVEDREHVTAFVGEPDVQRDELRVLPEAD